MLLFRCNDVFRLLFVIEGKNRISEFTIRMVAKALDGLGYYTQIEAQPLSLDNASSFFSHYYPDGVIINDFIVEPDVVKELINRYPTCKFYVRDIHSNLLNPDLSNLFSKILSYIKSGAIVLTTSKCVYQFNKILPFCGIKQNLIKWAPDLIMCDANFNLPKITDMRTDKFDIGLYVDDIGVSGNIVIPFLGATHFAYDNRQPTRFHLFAEHDLSKDSHMKSILDLPQFFSFISLDVHDELTFDGFISFIPQMQVLMHLTMTNAESSFCSLGIRSNVPVLRSLLSPTFLKSPALVWHEDVESISRKLTTIYKEEDFLKGLRLFRQNLWLSKYNKYALKQWKRFLPNK